MNRYHEIAIRNHCRLAAETARPCFGHLIKNGIFSLVLSVNSGYE